MTTYKVTSGSRVVAENLNSLGEAFEIARDYVRTHLDAIRAKVTDSHDCLWHVTCNGEPEPVRVRGSVLFGTAEHLVRDAECVS